MKKRLLLGVISSIIPLAFVAAVSCGTPSTKESATSKQPNLNEGGKKDPASGEGKKMDPKDGKNESKPNPGDDKEKSKPGAGDDKEKSKPGTGDDKEKPKTGSDDGKKKNDDVSNEGKPKDGGKVNVEKTELKPLGSLSSAISFEDIDWTKLASIKENTLFELTYVPSSNSYAIHYKGEKISENSGHGTVPAKIYNSKDEENKFDAYITTEGTEKYLIANFKNTAKVQEHVKALKLD